MAYVGRDGDLSLWINDPRKEGQYDASGYCWLDGKEYRFNIDREPVGDSGRNKKYPTHKGFIDYNGDHRPVALWKDENPKTENHPSFSGTYEVDGKQYRLSLWKMKASDNPKGPDLRGRIQFDSFKTRNSPDKSSARDSAPVKDSFSGNASGDFDLDDDIPF